MKLRTSLLLSFVVGLTGCADTPVGDNLEPPAPKVGRKPLPPQTICMADSCTAAPDATCLDENTKRVFDDQGSCRENACDYAYRDVACKACPACAPEDLCDGVTCATPPDPSCVDRTTRKVFAATGTCSEGRCAYTETEETAPAGQECILGEFKVRMCEPITDPDAIGMQAVALWAGTRRARVAMAKISTASPGPPQPVTCAYATPASSPWAAIASIPRAASPPRKPA